MSKFHISRDGQPRECRAEISCRLGGEDRHFDTPEAAREAFEKEAESKFGTMVVLRRGVAEPESGAGVNLLPQQLDSETLKPFAPTKAEQEFLHEKARVRIAELKDRLKDANAKTADARARYLQLSKNPASRIFKKAELKSAREQFVRDYAESSMIDKQIGAIGLTLNTMNAVVNQVTNKVRIRRPDSHSAKISDQLKRESAFYSTALSEDFDDRANPSEVIDPANPSKKLSYSSSARNRRLGL